MTRLMLAVGFVASIIAAQAAAETRTYFGFQVGITNAPPPPAVVFHGAPDVVLVPQSRVYVVDDDYGYDVFRYGPYWYMSNGAYWYRARSYGGPYRVVDVRYVPRTIFYVPADYWKHHPHGGPPGHWKHGHGKHKHKEYWAH